MINPTKPWLFTFCILQSLFVNTESGPCRINEGKSVILDVDYNISKPFYYLRIGSCTAYIYCQVIDARGSIESSKCTTHTLFGEQFWLLNAPLGFLSGSETMTLSARSKETVEIILRFSVNLGNVFELFCFRCYCYLTTN